MTTLADMTPEQRQQCVGMWFDTIFGLGILEALQEEPKEGDPFGRFMHPDRGSWHTETFKGLTPPATICPAPGTPTAHHPRWNRKPSLPSPTHAGVGTPTLKIPNISTCRPAQKCAGG